MPLPYPRGLISWLTAGLEAGRLKLKLPVFRRQGKAVWISRERADAMDKSTCGMKRVMGQALGAEGAPGGQILGHPCWRLPFGANRAN
jgi:hypothetical protein